MADVRDRLLDAAARVYAEHGFRGATTRLIAAQAGVNEISLFRHFGSKEALVRSALERAGLQLMPPALPDQPGDPFAEVGAWTAALWEQLAAHRSMIRTCMGEVETHPDIAPSCGSAPAEASQALCRYLERLQESGRALAELDPGPAATMLMGAVFADAMGRDVMPEMYPSQPDEAVTQYVRLFLRAVGVEKP